MSYFTFLWTLIFSTQVFAQNPGPKSFPNLKANFTEVDGTVDCNLDNKLNIYLCKHSGGEILLKKTYSGYSAIGFDSKGDPKSFPVKNIYNDTKPIYMSADTTPYISASPASDDYLKRVKSIESFFAEGETFSLKKLKDSPTEKIIGRLLTKKDSIKQQFEEAFNSTNYTVELENGQKTTCQRSPTRKLTKEEQNYSTALNMKFQCGGFKCDPVTVNGKTYQATMLYQSSALNAGQPSIHLTQNNELGPNIGVKKLSSSQLSQPLIDNSEIGSFGTRNVNTKYFQSMLPENLKGEDRTRIAEHKNPAFDQVMKFNESLCSDPTYLAPLVDARKNLFKKLADLDMQEFIRVLADGSLVGAYIDPTRAAEFGCLYNGLILDENAAKNLSKIKKDFYPDRQVEQTISMERATQLFNKAKKMKDIAWNYKLDGCYARAHLMARRFEAEGVRVDKVWIKGDLAVPEAGIRWNFHVAPIVYVDDGKGGNKKMVIDPSLFNKPVTVEEWDNKMTKGTVKGSTITAFPFPDNAAFFERSALSFSSSDPYLPRDSIYMSEEDKMGMATLTMQEYKTLEP